MASREGFKASGWSVSIYPALRTRRSLCRVSTATSGPRKTFQPASPSARRRAMCSSRAARHRRTSRRRQVRHSRSTAAARATRLCRRSRSAASRSLCTNLALHKPVFVSSEFSPQFAGRFAVDGDPTTRWSSAFSDPQWIYVDLEQTVAVGEVILRWETAYGADYQVQMSNDAQTWTTIRSVTGGDGGVDDLAGLSGSGRYLRILGTQRGTEWGYSLFELEVYGAPDSPQLTDLARHHPAVASSVAFGSASYVAANAVDGNPATRWSSEFSDDQWIYVDLTEIYTVNEVILRWETAFGADYQVQVSDDASTWRTIRTVTGGDGGVDDLTGLSGTGRYVRILGTRRGTEWGYSLWSLEVYGNEVRSASANDLAAHRPAVASSVAFGRGRRSTQSNAVDGESGRRDGRARSAIPSGFTSILASRLSSTASGSRGRPRTPPTSRSRSRTTRQTGRPCERHGQHRRHQRSAGQRNRAVCPRLRHAARYGVGLLALVFRSVRRGRLLRISRHKSHQRSSEN